MQFPQEIHPFLKRHRIAVLSLVDATKKPHAASLHYAWNEASGSFLFFTRKGTLKYKALEGGKKPAALVIGFSEEEFTTIQMHGEVHELKDASTQEAYLQKFHYVRNKAKDADAVFLEFMPTWFRYSDLKGNEPVIFSSGNS